jgi:sugar/nucleoside kinase (ribokinase family)
VAAAWQRMDVRQCAVWGNVLGSLCVQAPGPIPDRFSLEEVKRLTMQNESVLYAD